MPSTLRVLFFLGILQLSFWSPAYAQTKLQFDPVQVAQEEVAAWKDYYDNDIMSLIQHLSHLVIVEFRLNQLTAWTTVIPELTIAATIFKNLPHTSSQYTYDHSVLPHLIKAYEGIKEAWQASWDPQQAAKDELDWWIYRRDIKTLDPEIVGKKIADLYQLLYGKNDEKHFIRAGYLRAVAARYRDVCQSVWQQVQETDWVIIANILEQSYKEMWAGIQANGE